MGGFTTGKSWAPPPPALQVGDRVRISPGWVYPLGDALTGTVAGSYVTESGAVQVLVHIDYALDMGLLERSFAPEYLTRLDQHYLP